MKNRSSILGLFAFALASVSALAENRHPLSEIVYVKIKSTVNTAWHCQETSLICSNTGSYLCQVNVTRDLPVPVTVVKTNGRTSSCEALLNSTQVVFAYNPNTISITDVAPYTTNPGLLKRNPY